MPTLRLIGMFALPLMLHILLEQIISESAADIVSLFFYGVVLVVTHRLLRPKLIMKQTEMLVAVHGQLGSTETIDWGSIAAVALGRVEPMLAIQLRNGTVFEIGPWAFWRTKQMRRMVQEAAGVIRDRAPRARFINAGDDDGLRIGLPGLEDEGSQATPSAAPRR